MIAHIRTVALCCAFAIFMASCASPKAIEPTQRIFIPSLPAEPKIEGIGVYSTAQDLKDPTPPSLLSFIIGDDQDALGPKRPLAIDSDGDGRVLVSDTGSASAYFFDFNKKSVYLFGGDSMTTQLRHPTGVAFDGEGNAYLADAQSRKIYVCNTDNKFVKVIDLSKLMSHIGMFTIDKTNKRIVAPDLKKHKVVVTDMNGNLLFSIGNRGEGDGEFNLPNGVAVDKNGSILVADSFNARIQRFDVNGKFVRKFGHRGDSPGDMSLIKDVAVDSEGHIYVTDGKENRITIFSEKGEYLLGFGTIHGQQIGSKAALGGFMIPQGIAIDKNDRIYIIDQQNNRFQVYQYLSADYLSRFPITGQTINVK